jgi:hypothetical protein
MKKFVVNSNPVHYNNTLSRHQDASPLITLIYTRISLGVFKNLLLFPMLLFVV